jgi:amidase
MCGLVALKPTRARISQAPDVGAAWGIGPTTDGLLTRTVRDTAAVLDQIAGGAPGDPFPAPSLARPLVDELTAEPGRLKIGVLDRPPVDGVPADAEAAAAVAGGAALLERLGHVVEAGHPAALAEDVTPRLFTLLAASLANDLDHWSERLGRRVADEELEPQNAGLAALGRGLKATEFIDALEWMHGYQRRVASWWADDGFDVLVTPTVNGAAPPIGALSDPEQGRARGIALWQFTAQFSVTGQPALTLPLHRTPSGLPIGVQLVADYGREDVLIRLAAQIEAAAPWADVAPSCNAFAEAAR